MRIACIYPNPHDITSFWRGAGPFNALIKKHKDIIVSDISHGFENMAWAEIGRFDLVFMQRPQSNYELWFIEACKQMGVPVIGDYDDNLIEVPSTHFAAHFYNQKERQERIIRIISLLDGVIVSTQSIKDKWQLLNPKIWVVRNSLDTSFLKPSYSDREKVIAWRGSQTHVDDVYSYKDQIIRAAKKLKGFKFLFFGDDFAFIRREISNYQFFPQMGIIEYLTKYNSVKPMVHIVPQNFDGFNDCKSSIALLEANWAGAICVCPRMSDWGEALVGYDNAEQFYHNIMDSIDAGKKVWEMQNAKLGGRTLEVANQQRVNIFNKYV